MNPLYKGAERMRSLAVSLIVRDLHLSWLFRSKLLGEVPLGVYFVPTFYVQKFCTIFIKLICWNS